MARARQTYSAERPSLEYLSHRGPYDVVAGDLGPIGMPGLVFAPDTGPRLPAVVLAHGYLQPAARYADTLRFLASWGFVAAAPATERGPLPSYSGLAVDVRRALDRLSDAALNRGRVTVDRKRLAVVGHGTGGGAAVLAAAANAPAVQATVTIFAAPVSPPAVAAAGRVSTPALHLVAGADALTRPEGDGLALARAWGGPAQVRRLKGAHHLDATEGKHVTSTLLGHRESSGTLQTIRSLVTGFLLLNVAGHDQLAEELEGPIGGTRSIDFHASTEAASGV